MPVYAKYITLYKISSFSPFCCNYLPEDDMAIVKMKDIIASEFQVEIEHKQQKMNDVEQGIFFFELSMFFPYILTHTAIANLNAQWRQLQEIWARKQYDPAIDASEEGEGKKKRNKSKKGQAGVLYARRPDGQYVSLTCPCCNKCVFNLFFMP